MTKCFCGGTVDIFIRWVDMNLQKQRVRGENSTHFSLWPYVVIPQQPPERLALST